MSRCVVDYLLHLKLGHHDVYNHYFVSECLNID